MTALMASHARDRYMPYANLGSSNQNPEKGGYRRRPDPCVAWTNGTVRHRLTVEVSFSRPIELSMAWHLDHSNVGSIITVLYRPEHY